MNSSLSMVDLPSRTRSIRPFEKQRQCSWVSRMVGFLADCQEPHAQEPFMPLPLRQMTSPRMKKPKRSVISWVTRAARGTYGLRPRLATLTTARPPGSSTRWVSANTRSSIWRYSANGTSVSYSLPTW